MTERRRPLSHQGGAIHPTGDPEVAGRLVGVLERASRIPLDRAPRRLTHGFHSYPARMDPLLADAALAEFPPGQAPGPKTRLAPVLDPFCGSGTVLVEARARGLPAVGVDLSPLAIRLATVQTAYRGPVDRERFATALARVAASSEARVRARTYVRAPLSASERAWYAPHVLLELAGLHAEIRGVDHRADRSALEVVFSAIVVKFSRQRADTAEQAVERRVRKGLVTEFFHRKGEELCDRWAQLAAAMDERPARLRLVEADARRLREALPPAVSAGLVLTSPPYGGTYDYLTHHVRRYPWLGFSTAALSRDEIGARRNLSRGRDAPALQRRWDRELGDALASIVRVTAAGGWVLLWLGDGRVAGRYVDADRQIQALARQVGLVWRATASQQRPDFGGGTSRREHLIALQPRVS